jgi:hypothetical protein
MTSPREKRQRLFKQLLSMQSAVSESDAILLGPTAWKRLGKNRPQQKATNGNR